MNTASTTSTHTPLTSRERVIRALERRDHDRVPRHEGFWNDTIAAWNKQGFTGDHDALLDFMRSDIRSVGWVWVVPFPGECSQISEDADTITMFDDYGATVRYWKKRSGTPEHLAFACDSPDLWRSKFRPAFESVPLQINLDNARAAMSKGSAADRFLTWSGVGPVEIMRRLLGDEGMALAIGEDPDWVIEMAEVFTDAQLKNFQAGVDAGIEADCLWIYEDLAYTASMFFSPAAYEKLFWPSHARMCRWAHERGMKFIFHTDGDVKPVIPLFIKAGFDAMQPMEAKSRMDVRELAPIYGGKITFFGNIDVRVLSSNDLEKIGEEVRGKLRAGMANKGYIAHSDHSIPPDMTFSSFKEFGRLVDEHGNY